MLCGENVMKGGTSVKFMCETSLDIAVRVGAWAVMLLVVVALMYCFFEIILRIFLLLKVVPCRTCHT